MVEIKPASCIQGKYAWRFAEGLIHNSLMLLHLDVDFIYLLIHLQVSIKYNPYVGV